MQLLFPPSIEEYVSKNNIVRVIDEYVGLIWHLRTSFEPFLKIKDWLDTILNTRV